MSNVVNWIIWKEKKWGVSQKEQQRNDCKHVYPHGNLSWKKERN